MFATFTKLFAGSAFAAVLAVPQLASAGCAPSPACPAPACPAAQAGVDHGTATPSAVGITGGPASSVKAAAAPITPLRPPVAQGRGRVVRRFSYEPASAAVQGLSPAPTFRPAPAFRSSAPRQSASGMRSGGFHGGLTGGARLNPGHGR